MLVHDIADIKRKNPLIAYRREYSGTANLGLNGTRILSCPIEFSVELTPLGSSVIKVKLLETPDYPSLPIITALKERVHDMDRAGSLP